MCVCMCVSTLLLLTFGNGDGVCEQSQHAAALNLHSTAGYNIELLRRGQETLKRLGVALARHQTSGKEIIKC